MKKVLLRSVSLLLSLLMLCGSLPLYVFADTTIEPILPDGWDSNIPAESTESSESTEPTDPVTISAWLEEDITYGKATPVNDATDMLALRHGKSTTGLSACDTLASGTELEKSEYLYIWFYAPVYSAEEALKYSYYNMTPLGEDMYGGWSKIAGEFSTLSDYAEYFRSSAEYNQYITDDPNFPDVTYEDIFGDYWEKYMGGAEALAVGCLVILIDASAQEVATCAFTQYNACVKLGGDKVKITRDGDIYEGDSVTLRYGSLNEDTVRLTATAIDPEGTPTYQWYRKDDSTLTPITGATSATFDAPSPFKKSESVQYTCGVTVNGETYYPAKPYTIARSDENRAYHMDLEDYSILSGATQDSIRVYMSYYMIKLLLEDTDPAYFSVEIYSVPSKDSYENSTLIYRREPFQAEKLSAIGDTGYLTGCNYSLELGETKYFYAVIYYHGNSADGEIDMSKSSRTNICERSRIRSVHMSFHYFLRPYGDIAYQGSQSAGLTQRVGSTTSFIYPWISPSSSADTIAMNTLVDRFTFRVYATETDVREGGTLLAEKTYTHEELQAKDIGSLVHEDFMLQPPSDTEGVSYIYGAWEAEIDGETCSGVSEESFKVVTEGTNEDMFVFEDGAILAYKGAEADVVIPSSIGGVRVTEITAMSYRPEGVGTQYSHDYDIYRKVVIPEGVTTIGKNAFRTQKSLEEVVFPSTLTWIGDSSFRDCTALKKVDLSGLTGQLTIRGYAFVNCTSLKELIFPESESAVVEITIDAWTAQDQGHQFSGTPKAITIKNLKQINNYGHTGHKSSCFSNDLGNGSQELFHAAGTDAVFIPSEDGQFMYYYHAEKDAYSIAYFMDIQPEYFTIETDDAGDPQVVIKDLPLSFNGKPVIGVGSPYTGIVVSNYTSFVCDQKVSRYDVSRVELNDAYTYIGAGAFRNINHVKLPHALTTVGDYAFYRDESDRRVDECVTIDGLDNVPFLSDIGALAFYAFLGDSLTSLVFEHDVTIGARAFGQPSRRYDMFGGDIDCLESLTFRGNVNIGPGAFYRRMSLKTVEFGEGKTVVLGQDAFDLCFNIETVTNLVYSDIIDGRQWDDTEYGFTHFRWTKAFPDVVDSVTSTRYIRQDNWCISGDSRSKKNYTHDYYVGHYDDDIILPGTVGEYSVYRIDEDVMQYHYGDGWTMYYDGVEYKLTIGEGITTIEGGSYTYHFESPYSNCVELILPSGITVIDEWLFAYNPIRKLTLPSDLTRIEEGAFKGCPIEGELEIPATVTSIGAKAFYGAKITTLKLHEGLKTIDGYNFQSSPNLTRIISVGKNDHDADVQTFPDSLTSIGASCFTGDSSAEGGLAGTLVLPAGLTVGASAFSYHGNLKKVIAYCDEFYGTWIDEVPELGSYFGDAGYGYGAFRHCPNLEEVDLSQSTVTYLPEGFLAECPRLNTLLLPTTLESIAAIFYLSEAPYLDAGLFILPDGLQIYDAYTSGSLTLPDSVIYVNKRIFDTHSVITFLNRDKVILTQGWNSDAGCNTSLALPTSIPDTCLIRCYKDSFIYNWCVENSIRYELIEDSFEASLTVSVKAPDGTPLTGLGAIRWVDTTTGLDVWQNSLTYTVPTELAGHTFECIVTLTTAQLDSYQSKPTITFAFDTSKEDYETSSSLTLGTRTRVTVKGTFPQYAVSGFTARLIHTDFGIDREITVGDDGSFELAELLRADGYIIRLDVITDGERIYKPIDYKVSLYASVGADGILTLGELTMQEAEPMLSLPVYNDNISGLSMTLVRKSDGTEFSARYDSYRQAIRISDPQGLLRRGEEVILRCATNDSRGRYFADIAFEMPGEYADDFIMSLDIKQLPKLSVSQNCVRILAWDADGKLVASVMSSAYLLPGTYTVIGIDYRYVEQLDRIDVASLDGFRALDLPAEAMAEQTITVDYGADATFDAEVKTLGYVYNASTNTTVYVYNAAGKYVGKNSYGGKFYLMLGDYTLIGISSSALSDEDIPQTLADFEALGFSADCYVKKTIRLALADTYSFKETVTPIIDGVRYLVTMDMNHVDALGRVPICINYKKIHDSARFPLSFTVVDQSWAGAIVDLGDGKYASIDSAEGLGDMVYTMVAERNNRLTFTSTAEEGNIWLYVLANGDSFQIKVGSTTITTLQPQQKKFSSVAPPEVIHSTRGTIYLNARYPGKRVKAEMYVDDELQKTITFSGSTSQAQAIPYTVKAYEDGYSEHTLQIVCYDDETDEYLWSSDIYTVKHTNNEVAEPEKLNIELVNYNQYADGRAYYANRSIYLNANNGTSYNRLNIDAVPVNFSDDGTWKNDVTLNFSLEATNPTGLKDVSVRLWCNETAPYRRSVQMVYNAETGRFEGSITWSGGKFTIFDLPYGLDVLYTQSQTTITEDYSLTAMLDRVAKMHEERNEWQKADEERQELLQSADIDLYMLLLNEFNAQNPDNAFDEEEMEILTSLMAAWNELCDANQELYDEMEAWAAGFSSTGDPYGDLNDILAFCNGTTGTLASVSLDGITTQQLLDNGFVMYECAGRTVYVHKNGVVADMELNALVYSDPSNIPGDLYAELFSARMRRMAQSDARIDVLPIAGSELCVLSSHLLDLSMMVVDKLDAYIPDDVMSETLQEKVVRAEKRLMLEQKVFDAKMANTEFSMRVKALDEATEKLLSQHSSPSAIQKIKDNHNDIYTYLVRESYLEHYDEQQKALKPLNEAKASLKELQAEAKALEETWQSNSVAQNRARLREIKGKVSALKSKVHIAAASKYFTWGGKLASLLALGVNIYWVKCDIDSARCSIDEKRELLENFDYFNRLYTAYQAGCLKGVSTYDQWRDFIREVDKAASEAAKLIKKLEDLYFDRQKADYMNIFYSVASFGISFSGAVGTVGSLTIDIESALITGIYAAIKDGQIEDTTDDFWEQINVIRDALARIDSKCMKGDDPQNPDDPDDPRNGSNGATDPSHRFGNPRLDPAGFVYEAVYSNRIEGLTAKVFYKGEDGEPVFWEEASLYGEVNPQITDEYGQFAWMTPIGEWLVVIYDADGNEIASSRNDPAAVDGWLPVPPPQLKVYIGIVSDEAPTVSAAGASTGKVQMTFSQYMDIGYILSNPSLVSVTQDGRAVEVNISFSDQEERPAADGVFYGRVMVLTRKDGKPFEGDNIRVTVDGRVKNYAGTAMGTDYDSGAMTATQVAKTVEHSYPNRLVIKQGATETIALRVIDENGLTMAGVTVTVQAGVDGILAFETLTGITDANGRVTFTLTGVAEGDTVLSFTTDNGVSCEMNARTVAEPAEKPQKPTANIEDYVIVGAGSKLILSSATEGAVIYYTTNDTCPCTDSDERHLYTGEITLTQSGFYRIVAYTEDGGYSERLNIHVIVVNFGDVNGDGAIDAIDIAALRLYLAGVELELAPGADTNADGVVDEIDLERLRRYLIGGSTTFDIDEAA